MLEKYYPYIIGLVIVIILIIVLLIIRKSKSKNVETIDIEWLLTILGKDNINEVKIVNKRVRITFNDLKKVDIESLKSKTKGVFITGSSILVTFINNEEEIYQALKKYTN